MTARPSSAGCFYRFSEIRGRAANYSDVTVIRTMFLCWALRARPHGLGPTPASLVACLRAWSSWAVARAHSRGSFFQRQSRQSTYPMNWRILR